MIHLDDIQQGADIRNYRWQRLINAVRQACNLTVTAPLEMHQSWSGTVISLGGAPDKPHWHGTGSNSGVTSLITLDLSTTVLSKGGIFTLSSDELDIAATRDFEIIADVQLTCDSTNAMQCSIQMYKNASAIGLTKLLDADNNTARPFDNCTIVAQTSITSGDNIKVTANPSDLGYDGDFTLSLSVKAL